MADDWTFNLEELRDFIKGHPLRDEFLDWLDEHESAVEGLKSFAEEQRARGQVPVEGKALVEQLQIVYGEAVDKRWAPLFSAVLVREFPKLGGFVRPGTADPTEEGAPAQGGSSGAGAADTREHSGEGGEAA